MKPFFAIHSNFTCDSDAYVIKLNFETLPEILFFYRGLFSYLPGSPDSNPEVLTIRTLLQVQCRYRKTFITSIKFLKCNSADISLPCSNAT